MALALCAHTDHIPTNFDYAIDTMVEHATADEEFIVRHLAYERFEPVILASGTPSLITKSPHFNLFDDRMQMNRQGELLPMKTLALHA